MSPLLKTSAFSSHSQTVSEVNTLAHLLPVYWFKGSLMWTVIDLIYSNSEDQWNGNTDSFAVVQLVSKLFRSL